MNDPLRLVKVPEGLCPFRARNVVQIGGQRFVQPPCGAVIGEGNDRDADILFQGLEERLAHQGGTAEEWIDMGSGRGTPMKACVSRFRQGDAHESMRIYG